MPIAALRISVLVLLICGRAFAVDALLVADASTNQVLAYDAATGAFLKVFASGGGLRFPNGMALGPDGSLYLSSTGSNQVLRFDRNTGAFIDAFVPSIPGPSALAWGPDGNLYVGSLGPQGVSRCQGRTGAILATFGHNTTAMSFGGDGNLYIANTPNNTIDVFDPVSGALLRSFGSGTGLDAPAGILFRDGTVYVANNGSGKILRYTTTGAVIPPIPSGPELSRPFALAFSPDGSLLVSTSTGDVLRYEVPSGRFLGRLVSAGSGGLQTPVSLAVLTGISIGTTPPPDSLKIVSGDSQTTAVRSPFPAPLMVQALAGTTPAASQTIQFDVTSGAAFVTSPRAVTDGNGNASTFVIAMNSIGPVSVRASVGTLSVVFNLTVSAPPPRISSGGVLHAARRTPLGIDGSQIPLGGAIVIQGEGLGPVVGINASTPYPNRLPDDASGASVRLINLAGNTAVDAPVVYASNSKVVAIVPSATPLGATSVAVTYLGRQSNPVTTAVVNSNFGIYARNDLGNGPAVALTVDDSGSKQPIGLGSPARAGQIVAIRGTGLGPISTPDNAPSNAGFDLSQIRVILGGLEVSAMSAGRVMDAPAMDEIQFRIPDDTSVPDGCYLPVAVRIGTHLSNFATIPKAAAGTTAGCDHPLKLSGDAISRLDSGGSILAGIFGVTRLALKTPLGPGLFVAEGGIFAKLDSNTLFLPGGITTMTLTDGSCTVYQAAALPGFQSMFPVMLGTGLDAGPDLTLAAPDLHTDRLTRRFSGGYDKSTVIDGALLPKELQGTWTLSGPGGADVKAFTGTLELPPPITWSNKDDVNDIDRTKDLMITWQTDGEARFDRVIVSGGMFRGSEFYGDGVLVQFACSAPFYTGFLTVPSMILGQLPASSNADYLTFFSVANSAFDARSVSFPARSSDDKPLDTTVTTYVIGDGKVVTFK